MQGINAEVLLQAEGINKSFPGVKALTDVNLVLHKGEIVALLGENGAGKSTLIKVLSGIYQADTGTMRLDGKEVHFELPSQARDAGIGVIHQELNYVPTISIAENIFMGRLPRKHGFVDYRTLYAETRRILSLVGLDLDPRMTIGQCSVAQKQLIEIAKVLSCDARILILDEPTSALNDIETEYLFTLVRRAAQSGISILYISHKLDELFAIANRVVVLRDGCVTGEVLISEATKDDLIARMVGRKMNDLYPKGANEIGEVVMKVENLTTESIKDVSFETRRGEIFGIYGLMGSGHQQIGAALFGQDQVLSGAIVKDGKQIRIDRPRDAIANGIAYVPAERKTEGLVLNQSVAVNLVAGRYSRDKSHLLREREMPQSPERGLTGCGSRRPAKKPSWNPCPVETSRRLFLPDGWSLPRMCSFSTSRHAASTLAQSLRYIAFWMICAARGNA